MLKKISGKWVTVKEETSPITEETTSQFVKMLDSMSQNYEQTGKNIAKAISNLIAEKPSSADAIKKSVNYNNLKRYISGIAENAEELLKKMKKYETSE